jgi:hypothetical protein
MIYAGATFKNTLMFIAKSNFSENEIEDVKTKEYKELDDAVKEKMAIMLLFSMIISATKIIFYPIFIAAKISIGRR